MRNYQELHIWVKAIDITKEVYLLSTKLPDEEKYGLKSQMRRASVSICSNIAEGCGRGSDLEFKRFLEIALGSAYELESQLIIVKELGLLSQKHLQQLFELVTEELKMINSFIQKLKANS